MYGVNDVFDYESDIKNPRKGGIEGAITPKKYHRFILASSVLLCAPFIFYMFIQGIFVSKVCLVMLLFFVIAYSINGLRFKEIPFLDSITSSIHFVGPLVYSYTVIGDVSKTAWQIALAFFFWGVASHSFGAVQDIKPDRKADISSIATFLGARATIRFSMACYSLAAVIVLAQGGIFMVLGFLLLFYVVNIAGYRDISDKQSETTNAAWKRFLYLNYLVGAFVTIVAVIASIN